MALDPSKWTTKTQQAVAKKGAAKKAAAKKTAGKARSRVRVLQLKGGA